MNLSGIAKNIRIQLGPKLKHVLIVSLLMLCAGICLWVEEQGRDAKIKGRVLEGCSCSVPCPCNFGGAPSPNHFCESVAFFELQTGKIDGVSLKGLRFAIAERGAAAGIIYLDSSVSKKQADVIQRVANWVLSLEGTPVTDVLRGTIRVDFGMNSMRGSVVGTGTYINARPLTGSDGTPSIMVSHPWIFGSFPVSYAQKGMTEQLAVHAAQLKFDYTQTNANDGAFEFLASQVK